MVVSFLCIFLWPLNRSYLPEVTRVGRWNLGRVDLEVWYTQFWSVCILLVVMRKQEYQNMEHRHTSSHIHMHACEHTITYIHTRTHTHTCMHTKSHKQKHIYSWILTCTNMYTHMCILTQSHAYIHTCSHAHPPCTHRKTILTLSHMYAHMITWAHTDIYTHFLHTHAHIHTFDKLIFLCKWYFL